MRLALALAFALCAVALAEPITPGQWYNGTVVHEQYHHFTIEVAAEYGELAVMMTGKAGDPDLYLRFDAQASKENYDVADTGINDDHVVRLRANEGSVRLQPGTYHIAVYAFGQDDAVYALRAILQHCPGGCSGHGTCDRATKSCSCDPGYVTDKADCSAQLIKMKIGDTLKGSLPKLSMLYVEFDLTDENVIELEGRIQRMGGHAHVAAYLRRGALPSADVADAYDYDMWGSRRELSVRLVQEHIRSGKWYLAVDNEREATEAFPYEITLSAHACPRGCSGHGKCDREKHTCTCDPLWVGSKDCSAATFPLTLGVDTPLPILGREKTNIRINIPDEAQQTGSALVVRVRTHAFSSGSPVYPRVYLNPLSIPDETSHWAANRLPQQTDTARIRVARDDLVEQGTKWYVQLDNSYEYPVNVSVRAIMQAYCAHGTSTVRGSCQCESGWTGKNCEEDKSHITTGVAVLVAILTMAFGIVVGFFIKRQFPQLCAKKEADNLQYNHLDR